MKKSRLTLFIFIALVLGVVAGYIYNTYVFADLNKQLSTAGAAIKAIDKNIEALPDTTVAAYKDLKLQRIAQVKLQSLATDAREDKLELYNILSKIFLNLIKMIVAPLVFTTLVVGVAKVGDIKAVGRIGGKTMLWFISATLVSLLLGMLLVNLFEPGKTMHLPLPDSHLSTGIKKTALSLTEFVGHVFPKSFIEAMANNEILQIVVFSLFFGVATAAIGEQGKIVINAMDAFAHVIMKITGYVMKMAPLAVFGAITAVVAKQGLSVLSTYGIFIGEFYFSLIVL